MAQEVMPGAACFMYQREDGLVMAVPRRDGSGYGLPGGKREPGETIWRTVQRELEEETGYRCEIDEMYHFHERIEEGETDYYVHYVASTVPPVRVGEPEIAVEWVTREELLRGPFGKHLLEVFARYDEHEGRTL